MSDALSVRRLSAKGRVSNVARREVEMRSQLREAPPQVRDTDAEARSNLCLRERHMVYVDDGVRHGRSEGLEGHATASADVPIGSKEVRACVSRKSSGPRPLLVVERQVGEPGCECRLELGRGGDCYATLGRPR